MFSYFKIHRKKPKYKYTNFERHIIIAAAFEQPKNYLNLLLKYIS